MALLSILGGSGKLAACASPWLAVMSAHAADVVRYPLMNDNKFPIARAVEVPADSTLIFHSGVTPSPKDPNAPAGTPAYWGDTKTQALSAFTNGRTAFHERRDLQSPSELRIVFASSASSSV
jgi:hypothetical protein